MRDSDIDKKAFRKSQTRFPGRFLEIKQTKSVKLWLEIKLSANKIDSLNVRDF